ncbi:hypothetical protein P1X14_11680 [Sphingomonas sp. AOB5]|uniref:hypothetical protein n=1 Tax=Sphingomonas sp. AOB5 TaxID=3034017 RepID=UPI0023F8AC5E|nr:hypothetical protein [Sphingomonas sp. AOB5]MDF7775909.1 hypothetical protein [Sphingomonas sp. AOB5]
MARDELSDSLDKRSLRRYIYITAMKSGSHQDSAQAMQRVRVGLTGLAMVLVLIGLASAIFTSASRDGAVTAVGASNATVVANMAEGNVTVGTGKDEPLAELGVAPSTASTEAVNAAEIARRLEAERARIQTQSK